MSKFKGIHVKQLIESLSNTEDLNLKIEIVNEVLRRLSDMKVCYKRIQEFDKLEQEFKYYE